VSFALGPQSTASGFSSTAVGRNGCAAGDSSVVLGEALAIGKNSVALGNGAYAFADNSCAIGNVWVYSVGGAAVGVYNRGFKKGLTTRPDPANPTPADPIFEVGIGDANRGIPATAFTVFRDGTNYFSGNVGIGTSNPTFPLSVNGTVEAKEVIVQTGWSDYVFAPNYHLVPLSEVEQQIKTEKHLPGIPSAQQVAEHGISLGDMQAKLLAKIEELTLHQIEQEKQIQQQNRRIEHLEQENQELRKIDHL
jgi:hypothetical protein